MCWDVGGASGLRVSSFDGHALVASGVLRPIGLGLLSWGFRNRAWPWSIWSYGFLTRHVPTLVDRCLRVATVSCPIWISLSSSSPGMAIAMDFQGVGLLGLYPSKSQNREALLPVVLFPCVAAERPTEDLSEFVFENRALGLVRLMVCCRPGRKGRGALPWGNHPGAWRSMGSGVRFQKADAHLVVLGSLAFGGAGLLGRSALVVRAVDGLRIALRRNAVKRSQIFPQETTA